MDVSGENWKCGRPFFDVVTGKTMRLGLSARDERGWTPRYADACGREGKHFKAKDSAK